MPIVKEWRNTNSFIVIALVFGYFSKIIRLIIEIDVVILFFVPLPYPYPHFWQMPMSYVRIQIPDCVYAS